MIIEYVKTPLIHLTGQLFCVCLVFPTGFPIPIIQISWQIHAFSEPGNNVHYIS